MAIIGATYQDLERFRALTLSGTKTTLVTDIYRVGNLDYR